MSAKELFIDVSVVATKSKLSEVEMQSILAS